MRFLIIFAVLALPFTAIPAQDPRADDELLGRVFSEIERQIIHDYYRNAGDGGDPNRKAKKNRGGGGPPGIAKRDQLPPGLEMQLERWGRLPPGLERQGLPTNLSYRLGRPLDGLHRQVVGADVLLVETATGIILDILRGVAYN